MMMLLRHSVYGFDFDRVAFQINQLNSRDWLFINLKVSDLGSQSRRLGSRVHHTNIGGERVRNDKDELDWHASRTAYVKWSYERNVKCLFWRNPNERQYLSTNIAIVIALQCHRITCRLLFFYIIVDWSYIWILTKAFW